MTVLIDTLLLDQTVPSSSSFVCSCSYTKLCKKKVPFFHCDVYSTVFYVYLFMQMSVRWNPIESCREQLYNNKTTRKDQYWHVGEKEAIYSDYWQIQIRLYWKRNNSTMSCPCLPGLHPFLSCPTMRMYLIPFPHCPACNGINYKLWEKNHKFLS